jgi:hypothetical protein
MSLVARMTHIGTPFPRHRVQSRGLSSNWTDNRGKPEQYGERST